MNQYSPAVPAGAAGIEGEDTSDADGSNGSSDTTPPIATSVPDVKWGKLDNPITSDLEIEKRDTAEKIMQNIAPLAAANNVPLSIVDGSIIPGRRIDSSSSIGSQYIDSLSTEDILTDVFKVVDSWSARMDPEKFRYKESRIRYKGEDPSYLGKYYSSGLYEIIDFNSNRLKEAYNKIPKEVAEELYMLGKEWGNDIALIKQLTAVAESDSEDAGAAMEELQKLMSNEELAAAANRWFGLMKLNNVAEYNKYSNIDAALRYSLNKIYEQYPEYKDRIESDLRRQAIADAMSKNMPFADGPLMAINSSAKIVGGFLNFIPIVKESIVGGESYDWADLWAETVNDVIKSYSLPIPSNAQRPLFGKYYEVGNLIVEKSGNDNYVVRDRGGYIVSNKQDHPAIQEVKEGGIKSRKYFSIPTALSIIMDGTIQLASISKINNLVGISTAPLTWQRAFTVGQLTAQFANENYKSALQELGPEHSGPAARYAIATSAGQSMIAMINPMETNGLSGISIRGISDTSSKEIANLLGRGLSFNKAYIKGSAMAIEATKKFFYNVSTEGLEGALEHGVDQIVKVATNSGQSVHMDTDFSKRAFLVGAVSEALGGVIGSMQHSKVNPIMAASAWSEYINADSKVAFEIDEMIRNKFGDESVSAVQSVKNIFNEDLKSENISDSKKGVIASLIYDRLRAQEEGDSEKAAALSAMIHNLARSKKDYSSVRPTDAIEAKEKAIGLAVNTDVDVDAEEGGNAKPENVEIDPETDRRVKEAANEKLEVVANSPISEEIIKDVYEWEKSKTQPVVLDDTEVEQWNNEKVDNSIADAIADEFLHGTRIASDTIASIDAHEVISDNPSEADPYISEDGEDVLTFVMRIEKKTGRRFDEVYDALVEFIRDNKGAGWVGHIKGRLQNRGNAAATGVKPTMYNPANIDDAPIDNEDKKAVVSLKANLAVHDDIDSARAYLGTAFDAESGVPAGWYDPGTNTIHIVAGLKSSETIAHEVLHPYILAKMEQDPDFVDNMYDIIAKKDGWVSKYAKVNGKKEAVIQYFAERYKGEKTSASAKSKMINFIKSAVSEIWGKELTEDAVDAAVSEFSAAVKAGINPAGDAVEFQRLTPEIAKVRMLIDKYLPLVGKEMDDGRIFTRKEMIDVVSAAIGISRATVTAITESIEADILAAHSDKIFPPSKLPDEIFDFWSKHFSSRRGLPSELQMFKEAMNGSIEWEVKKAMKIFKKAKTILKGLSDREIDNYLIDRVLPISYTDDQIKIMDEMRSHIDALSSALIDEGYVSQSRGAIIASNIGSYLTRAYAIHIDSAYEPTDKAYQAAIRQYTKYWLSSLSKLSKYKNKSKSELESLAKEYAIRDVNDILETNKDKEYSAKSIPNISKDLGILKRRKDLPPEITSLIEKVKTGKEVTNEDKTIAVKALFEMNKKWEKQKAKHIKGYSALSDEAIHEMAEERIDAVSKGEVSGFEHLTEVDRELLGQYRAEDAYLLTIYRLSSLVEKSRFLQNVYSWGKDRFFFQKNSLFRPKDYNTPVVPNTQSYSPLNSLYTTKEIADAIRDAQEVMNMPFDANLWHKIVGIVNWGKTVGSPITHARNIFGNIPFIIGNGYISPFNITDVAKSANQAFSAAMMQTGLLSEDGSVIWTQENRAMIKSILEKLTTNGVIGTNVHMGILKDLLGARTTPEVLALLDKGRKNGTIGTVSSAMASGIKKIARPFNVAYTAEDDMFKVFAYLIESNRYAKAVYGVKYDQLTDIQRDQVDDMTMEIVKNILPNYDRIGELGKKIGRQFFFSNFVAFQIEAVRATYNAFSIGLKEMKSSNPGIRKIGLYRLIGGLSIPAIRASLVGFFGKAAGVGVNGIMGMIFDDDDESEKMKAIRYYSYPWQKYSDLIVKELGSGKAMIYDLSSTDPLGNWNRALNALMYSESNAFFDAAWQIVSPYIEPRIATEIASQMMQGVDSRGNKIILSDDSFTDKVFKLVEFALVAAGPGIIGQTKRIIDAEDKPAELFGMATGMKPYEFSYAESFQRKMYELFGFKGGVIEERMSYLNRQAYNKKITDATFYWMINDVEEKLRSAVMEAHKAMKYAKILGVEHDAIVEAVNKASGSGPKGRAKRDMIMNGTFSMAPWQSRIDKIRKKREKLWVEE